jgi:hypothetical protein
MEGRAEVDVHEGEKKAVEVSLSAAALGSGAVAAAPAADVPGATAPSTSSDVEAAADGETTRTHKPTVLTWTGIGVAGAGLLTGVITGVLSLSKKSALTGECSNGVCGPSSYGDLDSAKSMATVSDVAFAVAGVGAAVAVVTLVVGHVETRAAPAAAPPAGSGNEARIVPWLGLGSAGVAGTF